MLNKIIYGLSGSICTLKRLIGGTIFHHMRVTNIGSKFIKLRRSLKPHILNNIS